MFFTSLPGHADHCRCQPAGRRRSSLAHFELLLGEESSAGLE
jgi:hypothetical protein